ncbi:MAG: FAD-dependent monooxygenase [Planctomycetes bacterium]|nr:FAD-dependent monooxygenase [Planctomycetota bacterium]
MNDYDAIVIGAGPAGSSLALHLAAQGRSCALIDGATFPRSKVCGEGIMPHGLHALQELGIEPEGAPFVGLRYLLEDGTRAASRFPQGLGGLGVQRSELDAELVRRCQAEPRIDVRLGAWARAVHLPSAPGERASVELGDARLTAPVLVAADGCRSRIRRQAGLEAPLLGAARFGVGAHFAHAPRADPMVEVFLGSGYELYSTPVSAELTCVALLTYREGLARLQGDLEGGLRELLAASAGRAQFLADAPLAGGPVRGIGPLAVQSTRAHAEGLLLVGDAAGGLDPITGEGVSLALVTSKVASEVLAGAYARNDFSARRLAAWTRQRRRAVRGLQRFTQGLLYLSRNHAKAERIVRTLAEKPDTFERLLAVAAGTSSLGSLRLRDGYRLLVA